MEELPVRPMMGEEGIPTRKKGHDSGKQIALVE